MKIKREAGNLDLLTGVSHLKAPGFYDHETVCTLSRRIREGLSNYFGCFLGSKVENFDIGIAVSRIFT